MTHAEDEETGDAQTSTDEEATESQASADAEDAGSSSTDDEEAAESASADDEEAPESSSDDDEDTSDSEVPPGEVEDRGAGETSGMEDIRMVAQAIQESEQIRLSTSVQGDDEDDMLPGAGGGFGSIAGAALIRGPAQRDLVTPPSKEEPASKAKPLLFGAIVVLVVAVGALSWALMKGGNEQEHGSEMAAAQLSASAKAAPRPASLDVQKERDQDADPESEEEEGEASEPETGSAAEGATDPGTGNPAKEDGASDRRPTASRPRPKEPAPGAGHEPAKEKGDPKPAEQPEAPPQKKAEELGADCILNPELPECQDAAKKKKDESEKTDDTPADLPEKLTKNDVRAGFSAVKAEAKACGATHSVDPGTKVRVKVSISGKTGLVISATALGEHADDPVGKCVAEALSKATFGQFTKSVMGVTYPVTM